MAEEETVKTSLEWTLRDKVSSALHKIAQGIESLGQKFEHMKHYAKEGFDKVGEGAERVSRTLSRVTELGMGLAGIGAGIGFERMVETGRESLEQLKKISELTDMSGDSVAAWRDAFEQAGMQSEQFSRSITALSKKSLAMAEGSKTLVSEARQWGIVLDQGPAKSILTISKAVQQHKIDQGAVAKYMRISGEEAGAMMGFLKKGPEAIEQTIDQAKKLNVHLADGAALEKFERFHEASTKIHEAWRRISEKVIIQLAPTLARMSDRLSTWIDKINVDKVVSPLVKGFEFAVNHARLLGRIMLANAAIERMGGIGRVAGMAKGVLGFGGRVGGGIGGLLGKGVGIGAQVMGEAGLGGVGGAMGKVAGLLPLLGRVAGAALGIGAVAAAIYLVIKHLDYFKAQLGSVAMQVWSSVKRLGEAISDLLSEDSAIGRFMRVVGQGMVDATRSILGMVAKIFGWISDALDLINVGWTAITEGKDFATVQQEMSQKKNEARLDIYHAKLGKISEEALGGIIQIFDMGMVLSEQQKKMLMQWADAIDASGLKIDAASQRRIEAIRSRFKEPEKRGGEDAVAGRGGVYQDFRGSRFDIEQKFAEGFDPDRIGVAFSNDLGSLGERKMVSTLGPQFIR